MAKNSCQKKPNVLEILGTKIVQFWCYTKLIKTKKLLLNWYFSTKIFFRKIRRIFDVENQILALFDVYFWPFNKSREKTIPFFDQYNHSFNLKCFYQIPLTWWKTYPCGHLWRNSITEIRGNFHISSTTYLPTSTCQRSM